MDRSHPLLRQRIIFILITALFIALTVSAVVFFMVNVRVRTVTVENCVYSNEHAVIEAANIKEGTHSYAISKSKIAEAVKKQNTYVSDVRIKRTGITSISIILTEDKPCFYLEFEGRYLVLSSSLRVLDEYAGIEDMAHIALAPISIAPISEASPGKALVFSEGYEDDGKECIDILSQIAEGKLFGTITHADLSKRFDIRITYKDKYEIRFGSPKNFSKKLALVIDTIAFLEDPANNYSGAKGIIRASVNGETSFEPTGAVVGE